MVISASPSSHHFVNLTTTKGHVTERRSPMTTPTYQHHLTILADLRSLMPRRQLHLSEAKRITELQANLLLQRLQAGLEPPFDLDAALSALLSLTIERVRHLPEQYSGRTSLHGSRWLIEIDAFDPEVRQRFTLAHEFKHIIDHVHEQVLGELYLPSGSATSVQRREQLAHYFAACVLMPKRCVKRLWGEGAQDVALLAGQFEVSQEAMLIRLVDLGLVDQHRLTTFRAGQAAIKLAAEQYRREAAARVPISCTGRSSVRHRTRTTSRLEGVVYA